MNRARFLEQLIVRVKAGRGGQGNIKYGAIGGKGGDIILEALDNFTLEETRSRVSPNIPIALPGADSVPTQLIGKCGEHCIVTVPTNCVVYNPLKQLIGGFKKEGETLVVAKGGRGGSKITDFKGQPGMDMKITLVLKILADVGFVGFPNAGKSTLLRAISRATPKIAPYAFTTMQPHRGHMYFDDNRRISLADLPGLIEGAWNNEGLGHEFLKHVERTKLLLYVIDINGFQLSNNKPHRSAFECIMLLNKELEIYDSSLLCKPSLLVINKMDTKGSEFKFEELCDKMKNRREIYNSYPKEERPSILTRYSHMVPTAAKYRHKIEDLQNVIRLAIDDSYKTAENVKIISAKRKLKRMLEIKNKRMSNL